MRLYIIRHAEPDYPRDALTEQGHAQAQALACRLGEMRIDRVYSSPMNRALETARYSAERLGLEVRIELWARELEDWWIPDAAVGELPVWQVDAGILRALPGSGQEIWPLDALAQLRSSADDFLARHGYFRDGTKYRIANAPSQGVAVFCHAGFALTWLADLLAIPLPLLWSGFSLAPCSVTTVVFEELAGGGAAPRCIGLGDVAHLIRLAKPA